MKTCISNNSKIFARVVLTMLCILLSAAFAFAEEDTASSGTFDDTEIVILDLAKENNINQKVAKAFENENITRVRVIDSSNLEDGLSEEDYNFNTVRPLGSAGFLYRITNVKSASNYVGKSIIAMASGDPGITLTISQTRKVSCTFSASSGVTTEQITAAVGFNVTKEVSVAISGSYKVPKTKKVNGETKKVKKGYIEAYPVYKQKKFDTERRKVVNGVPGGTWKKYGSGNAKKPYGVDFVKRVTYK